jgi:hypothetical protein
VNLAWRPVETLPFVRAPDPQGFAGVGLDGDNVPSLASGEVQDAVDHQGGCLGGVDFLVGRAEVVELPAPGHGQVFHRIRVDLVERRIVRAGLVAAVRPPFPVLGAGLGTEDECQAEAGQQKSNKEGPTHAESFFRSNRSNRSSGSKRSTRSSCLRELAAVSMGGKTLNGSNDSHGSNDSSAGMLPSGNVSVNAFDAGPQVSKNRRAVSPC